MQSMQRTRRETSRLVLTGILCLLLAGFIAGCETTNGTTEVLQPRPHEHSHPESATLEDVRTEIQTMVGPVIESLVQETSAAIEKLRKEVEERLPKGDPLIYQVDYIFGDFDPAPDQRETTARLRFCGDLQRALTEWRERRGFHITPVVVPPPEVAPVWYLGSEKCEELVKPNRHFGFTLLNAQARSEKPAYSTHTHEINEEIQELAERHRIEDMRLRKEMAVPVRVDPAPAPLRVQKEARVYKATSGVGRAAPGTCEQTVRFDLSGDPKLVNAEIALVVYTFKGSEAKEHRPEGLVIENVIPCGGGEGENYILVVLQEPVVAQYRHLEYVVSDTGEEVKIVNEEQLPVPLIEGAPACPPKGLEVAGAGVPEWAAGPFRNELKQNWQTCEGHDW